MEFKEDRPNAEFTTSRLGFGETEVKKKNPKAAQSLLFPLWDWRETKAETEFKHIETEVVIYVCSGI